MEEPASHHPAHTQKQSLMISRITRPRNHGTRSSYDVGHRQALNKSPFDSDARAFLLCAATDIRQLNDGGTEEAIRAERPD